MIKKKPKNRLFKWLLENRTVNRQASKPIRSVDMVLVLTILALSIIGIIMVYNSSVAIAVRDFADQFYYIKEQLRGLAIGLFLFSFLAFINYHHLEKIAFGLFVINLVLLILVFVPGIGFSALGAHRWIRVLGVVVQPAELAKFTMINYLAVWFSKNDKKKLLPFLMIIGIVGFLVMLEPDMGTTIVLMTIAFVMYFSAGTPFWHFLIFIPTFVVGALGMVLAAPYRFSRLLTFLNPDRDPLGASYQITQALLAIGSGELFGVGLGMSRQKYAYLPEANTDSIFAVLAEETGFIGSVILLILFFLVIMRGLRIARNAPDDFSRLYAIGIVSWIGFQTALNLSAMMSLMPLTGIPLPLISYGSSSLVILLAALGILLNISRYSQQKHT